MSGCTLPPFPDHGSYVIYNGRTLAPGETVKEGTLLTYSCETNYDLRKTNQYSVCEENSTWDVSPECEKRCQMVSSYTVDFRCLLGISDVECAPYVLSGTSVISKCKEMHSQTYLPKLMCQNGRWNDNHGRPKPMCEPECGKDKSEGVRFISHGHRVESNAFPWHVGIYQDTVEFGRDQICGGSLIQRHVVISAAHCFFDQHKKEQNDPKFYRVAAGKFYRAWDHEEERSHQNNVQKSEIEQIFLHDDYRGDDGSEANDLALLVLKQPFKLTHSILPACYDFKDKVEDDFYFTAGTFGKVAGWGLNELQVSSEELRYLTVPVIDKRVCASDPANKNFLNYLTSDKICTGYTNGSSVCQGDSGGGLVFPRKLVHENKPKWFLRGIVSIGPKYENGTCHPKAYTAYTRITKLNDWLLYKHNELLIPVKNV